MRTFSSCVLMASWDTPLVMQRCDEKWALSHAVLWTGDIWPERRRSWEHLKRYPPDCIMAPRSRPLGLCFSLDLTNSRWSVQRLYSWATNYLGWDDVYEDKAVLECTVGFFKIGSGITWLRNLCGTPMTIDFRPTLNKSSLLTRTGFHKFASWCLTTSPQLVQYFFQIT